MKALEIDSRNPEALRWAAKAYAERGDIANELRVLKSAVAAAPADPFYLAPLFHMLTEKLGDFHQAKDVGEQAVRAGLEDGELHGRLGYVHYSLGDYEASLGHYARAVALEPASAQAQEGLGWALQALGRTREALAAFERAVRIAPYRVSAHVALARAYQRAKRYPDAIAAYERGIQLAVRGGDANFWDVKELCGLYQKAGALERAENCLQRLDAIQPGVAMVNRRLTQVRESLRLEQESR
jgi:tetratricopeptide (TPR) repeat protein